MGKRGGGRYFNKTTTPQASSKKKRIDQQDDRPDPEGREFYYDEVDEFHHHKDKVYLDKVRAVSPASNDEEVYQIRSDQEEEADQSEDSEDAEEEDMRSDISEEEGEEDYLPNSDAWGKRRKEYYSTDFAGDEHAGLNESDIEVAELEEQEAISLQKRLLQKMTADDFKLDSVNAITETKPSEDLEKNIVQTDLSSLTEEERFDLLKQQSPELLPLIDEYIEKSKDVDGYLGLVANGLLNISTNGLEGIGDGVQWVINKYELYRNYLLNLQFYFLLKATRQRIDNHPVIDRIMGLKKLMTDMDEKYGHLDQAVRKLAQRMEKGVSIKKELRAIVPTAKPHGSKAIEEPVVTKKRKTVHWGPVDEDTEDSEDENDGIENGEDIEEEKIEKRGVTYEIERNKGLTPKRKKEQRNPRVKNRSRFKKAVHKKKSQLPDPRREIQKYGGEIRGIKPNLVRSVKLH